MGKYTHGYDPEELAVNDEEENNEPFENHDDPIYDKWLRLISEKKRMESDIDIKKGDA